MPTAFRSELKIEFQEFGEVEEILNAEENLVLDSEIHGQVYSDLDSDGERDSDEPGYANATLSLFGYGDATPISLESRPYTVTINPATGLAYVGLRDSNLTIINPENGELVATIPISAVAHIAFTGLSPGACVSLAPPDRPPRDRAWSRRLTEETPIPTVL